MIMVGRAAFCLVVLATAVIAQVTLVSRMPLPYATPDLVLLAVIGFALAYGRVPGALIGFGTGLAVDLVPPGVTAVGRWALVLCLVGYVIGLAREVARPLPVTLGLVAGASAGALVLFAALGEVLGEARVDWPAVADLMPFSVAYDVALAPLLVLGIVGVTRRLGDHPAGGHPLSGYVPQQSAGGRWR